MTAVLLIADSERVQSVFADLESRGVLQLHAAATLDQFDQELAAVIPAFAFIQSRISGLSTGILLRHIKKALPESSRIILLSGDAAELQPGSPPAIPLVDLRAADDVLAETITGLVTGTVPPSPADGEKGAAQQGNGAKKRPPQEKRAGRKAAKGEQADAQESAKTQVKAKKPQEVEQAQQSQARSQAPVSQGAEQAAPAQAAKKRARQAKGFAVPSGPEAATVARQETHRPERSQRPEGKPAAVEPLEQARPGPNLAAVAPPEQAGEPAVTEPAASTTFMEIMAAASAGRVPDTSYPPEVPDRVGVGDASERANLTAPASEPTQQTEPWEPPVTSPTESFPRGSNPGEYAASRRAKMNKPLWLLLPLFAFLLIPAAAYLAGGVMSAQEQEARLKGDGVAEQRRALAAGATSAKALTPSRAAAETAPKGALPQEAADLPGLAALPPFLQGVERDRGYGDRHPGWERYLGANAEYRLFREDGRYRAIQAIARADEIPDQLFRRVLLEFGGIAGYVVESTGQKGEYLVEQAAGSGSASLTIYRKRNDARVRGLVVYYR